MIGQSAVSSSNIKPLPWRTSNRYDDSYYATGKKKGNNIFGNIHFSQTIALRGHTSMTSACMGASHILIFADEWRVGGNPTVVAHADRMGS